MEQYLFKGVKRKQQPNPTNWQFADHPSCKEMIKLPVSINLKDKFPPVYTQTCGSCTANAVLACDAYYYHPDNPNWIPSTVFTYYFSRKADGCKPTDPDEGSTVETALNIVRKRGACNSKAWPNSKPYWEKPSKEAIENGLKGHEITTYHNVKNMKQLKIALMNGYPVSGAVAWAFSEIDPVTHILNDVTKKEANKCDRGHAIVFVGYDDDNELIEIRNSWSKEWGNDGYGYITYNTFENVVWWDDTYVVVK